MDAAIGAFEDAAERARQLKGLSNDDKLKLYGLFKQATVGDCNTSETPFYFLFKERLYLLWGLTRRYLLFQKSLESLI